MHLKPLFGVILTLFLCAQSNAVPQEKKQDTINRTENSSLTIRTELSLNVFKSERYDAEYTVQVPYETTETYWENVPYYEEETYWEDVPYTERIPYTTTEDYYETAYVCENVTRYREECNNERICTPGGNVCRNVEECGTNARGERICKTRKVCEEGPRQCRDVRQCRQVPYTDRQCGYKQVRKTRTVTKYRDEVRYRRELRTRTVTKYHQEQRTRTVTKYREEIRCCVTKYRDVFDHQFTQPVSVVFPAGAELHTGETERVKFVLSGTETAPVVSIEVQSNIFDYAIAQTRMDGREKVFILKVTPKWNSANAGTDTVKNLRLSFNKGQGKLTFEETLTGARVVSTYSVEVRDAQSRALLLQHVVQNSAPRVVEIPTPGLVRDGAYTISLRVERRGANIVGGVIVFEQTTSYEKRGLDQEEVSLLRDSKQVSLSHIEGSGANRVVVAKDTTPAIEEIQTTYKLVVWKKRSNGKIDWLGEKKFPREAVQRADGSLGFSLREIGVNPGSDVKLYMDLVVQRESAEYLPQKVQFIVNKTF